MDVVIAGAGIGGLALAHGALAAGHSVRVYERAPAAQEGGAGVTIFSNGAAALADLGVRLDGIGQVIDDLRLLRSDGRELLHFDYDILQRRSGHPVRTVARRDLIARLTEGLPDGLVRYATAVDAVRAADGKVTVGLDTGDDVRADVVIGADGHRSAVRRAVLDPAPATDCGWATWQGLTPVLPELAAGNTGSLLVGAAGLVGMMPAGDGRLQWWFDVPWSPTAPPEPSPVEWLHGQFAHYAEPVPGLLAAIGDADLGLYPHVVHRVPDRWGDGPITLLGDAAHAFPPSQAQGANQALEDAWLLTRALSVDGDPAALLRRYEARRHPRVRLVSRMAASERTNRAPSALLAALARLTPATIASRANARLVYRFSSVLNNDQI